jgi:N-acetylmuramoyl-L-alanine amidase
MCLDGRRAGHVGRRAVLGGGAATLAWSALGGAMTGVAGAGAASLRQPAPVPVEVAPGLVILRRESWGADLPSPAGLATEAPGDVRVLVVHHSASPNGYGQADVAGQIREFHALHTGPERDWPDVAYNVLIDRFGRAWEGRAGSLDGPVIGDATGGNQGFSQLVCLIGNHVAEAPSPESIETLARVLAWLAVRDGVDVTPGATASFTSRGSSRWPAGATVETTTIAGHRDMSETTCPGDAVAARVRGDLPGLVAERAAHLAAATARPPTTAGSSAAPTAAPTTAAPPSTVRATAPPARPARPAAGGPSVVRETARPLEPSGRSLVPLVAVAAVATTAVAAPIALRRRRAGGVADPGTAGPGTTSEP